MAYDCFSSYRNFRVVDVRRSKEYRLGAASYGEWYRSYGRLFLVRKIAVSSIAALVPGERTLIKIGQYIYIYFNILVLVDGTRQVGIYYQRLVNILN